MPIQISSIKPLLDLISDSEKICKYIDIPFQHVSNSLLQRMRRGKSGSAVREAVEKLRAAIPGLTLRTSLIVGFPGETEADFEELLDFVEEAQFERLGGVQIFRRRRHRSGAHGRQSSGRRKRAALAGNYGFAIEISRKKNEALIGTIQRVMIDELDHGI